MNLCFTFWEISILFYFLMIYLAVTKNKWLLPLFLLCNVAISSLRSDVSVFGYYHQICFCFSCLIRFLHIWIKFFPNYGDAIYDMAQSCNSAVIKKFWFLIGMRKLKLIFKYSFFFGYLWKYFKFYWSPHYPTLQIRLI